jgi:hypothetical protein
VGEDIEISLMLLANYSSTTPLTRNTDDASAAYEKLGLLSSLAKEVKDYRISTFGGKTARRTRVSYEHDSPETKAMEAFVRKWIIKARDDGVQGNEANRDIHMHWPVFAKAAMRRYFKDTLKLDEESLKFDKAFLEKFRDRYSLDARALCRFVINQTVSDDDENTDLVPLTEFKTEYSFFPTAPDPPDQFSLKKHQSNANEVVQKVLENTKRQRLRRLQRRRQRRRKRRRNEGVVQDNGTH